LVQRVFSNESGKQLLAVLEAKFAGGDLLGTTVEGTYFNLGSREVVVYLQQLMAIRPM
jgi:hypothetical protein